MFRHVRSVVFVVVLGRFDSLYVPETVGMETCHSDTEQGNRTRNGVVCPVQANVSNFDTLDGHFQAPSVEVKFFEGTENIAIQY